MSELLRRIDAALASTSDEEQVARLLARRACYLARTGSFEDARELVQKIRVTHGVGKWPTVSVWIMVAEGLIHTFSEFSAQGADRLMRAQALAIAMRDRSLIAITSAWRAHWQFEQSDFRGMALSARTALDNAEDTDHEASARVYMVLANALSSCGEAQRARSAYALTRHHALEAGDQATIDALLYNKPSFALAWIRAQRCFGPIDDTSLDLLAKEVASSKTYQHIAGMEALSNFVFLSEARLKILRGEYGEAIGALESVRDKSPFADHHFSQALIDLEVAYCLLEEGGDVELAVARARSAEGADLSRLHLDEQLVAAWIRAKLSTRDMRFGDSGSATDELARLQREYLLSIEEMRRCLSSFDLAPPNFAQTTSLPPGRSGSAPS
jgi:tetratricopeptide (TPR) repeat protein